MLQQFQSMVPRGEVQEVNLVGLRSVAENIGLGRRFSRAGLLDTGRMRAEARRLLGRFDLDIDVRRPLDGFDGLGRLRQRVVAFDPARPAVWR